MPATKKAASKDLWLRPAQGGANAGIAAGSNITLQWNLSGFKRIVGVCFTDVAVASLVINQRGSRTGAVLFTKNVPVDPSQAATTYTFDEAIRAPYVEIVATQGGVPSTIFRAFTQALLE